MIDGRLMSSDNMEIYHLEKIFKQKELPTLIYEEFYTEVIEPEQKRINEMVESLTKDNAELGGSEYGYYYKNELYKISKDLKFSIEDVDDSLEERAFFIAEKQKGLISNSSFVGNFLTVLENNTSDLSHFVANTPREIHKFSTSIQKLISHFDIIIENKDWRKDFKFPRDDKEYNNFYTHYDRIIPSLKKYLFYRVVY